MGVLAASLTPALYGSSGITGTLSANSSVPLIATGGAVSAASLTAHAPLAPGGYISIFGSNLAGGSTSATAFPYPTKLDETQVLLGGEPVPLQYAGSGQINAVVPYDVPINTPQQLIVEQNGVSSLPETVAIAAAQPAVFTQDQSGKGAGAIAVVKANAAHSSSTHLVRRRLGGRCAGDLLHRPGSRYSRRSRWIRRTLLAAVDHGQLRDGDHRRTTRPSTLRRSGPGLCRTLSELNAIIPAGISTGSNVPVVLSVAGATSPQVTVAIQ